MSASFGGHDKDWDGAPQGAFDPGNLQSILVRHLRFMVNAQFKGGADVAVTMDAVHGFLRATAAAVDTVETELFETLSWYERYKVPEDERQKDRPRKVTAPLRQAAELIRISSGRPGATLKRYRKAYSEVGKKRPVKRPSRRRDFSFNPYE